MIQLTPDNGIPRHILLMMVALGAFTVANLYYNQPLLDLICRETGITQVRTLGEQNEQCRRLVNQRNEQRSFTDNQAMQKARKVTDAAYADFVMMLNAYNVVSLSTSQGQYEQAIQIINADIDYYKQWVLRKGGSSDEGGEDEEPETDGGNSDGGSDGGSG